MTTVVRGPMFEPAKDALRESVHGKAGGHYNIFGTVSEDAALTLLRQWFPDGSVNEMNFVLFSTSGIHGSYGTIEDVERDIEKYGDDTETNEDDRCSRTVTFLVVQPRIVGMTYGNVACNTLEDVAFLKRLRERSWAVMQEIGRSH